PTCPIVPSGPLGPQGPQGPQGQPGQNATWDNLKDNVKNEIKDAIKESSENENGILKKMDDRISALEKNKPSKLERVFNMVGTVMSFIQGIYSLVQFIMAMGPVRVPVSYTYNSGDLSLIWDGGYRETKFFGMIKSDEQKIEVDKIITPIPIVRPSNLDGYYYNGYLYSDVDDLRYEQVRDILRGKYLPSDIKTVYSFQDITNQSSIDRTYVKDTKEELAEQVFNDLKNWAIQKKTNNNAPKPSFVIEHSYKGEDGIYNVIVNDFPGTLANIKEKIRPALIAYKPKLDSNNYPIYDHIKNEDKSVPSFSLPYKTWVKKDNQIKENPDTLPHVLVDPNNPKWEETDVKLDTDKDVEDELKKQFYASFDVPSAKVFETDLRYINKFSNLQIAIENSQIYEAKGAYGEVKYFKDKQDAYDWVWNSYGVEAILEKKNKSVYVYKNRKLFLSKQEYLNWVFQNMEIITWTEERKGY
ncbi:MAG: hypothetical protein K2I49_00750, partial [Ureaplasma sp.]|nr:hypothetical protein [Ureaplasma sp.]